MTKESLPRPEDAELASRLRHVYWVGGASGAGKSTIARRLAARHGLGLYSTDEAIGRHSNRHIPEDCPFLTEFKKMTMDERWVNRSPQAMLDTFPWFHGEGFGLIVEDLLKLPPDQAIIVEGFRLLPEFVKPLLYRPNQGIWLIPTPEFRLAAFKSRGTLWSIAEKTNNPERALSNLLERDRLFTIRLRGMIESSGVPFIKVDDLISESDLEDRVATQLALR